MTTSDASTSPASSPAPKEKIIFEVKSLLLPTILNLENIVTIGFVVIGTIASVVFRFGLAEILIVVALFLILFIPSLQSIFRAGSTTYVLTNRRLVVFTVGIGNKERSIPLERIAGVETKSSIFQQVYKSGDVIIKQKGLRGTIRMIGISNFKDHAEKIRQAVKKASG